MKNDDFSFVWIESCNLSDSKQVLWDTPQFGNFLVTRKKTIFSTALYGMVRVSVRSRWAFKD